MPVSEETFLQLALEDTEGHWELYCGVPRRKPGMTATHNETMTRLFGWLFQQLEGSPFTVRSNAGHVRRSAENYFIPDVFVLPTVLMEPQRALMRLETYPEPLPLVVEIWSPSTGEYDVHTKLLEYQRRGDIEIWLIHPYEHLLTAWRRQADGTYAETVYTTGLIHPVALPNVTIDFDRLLA
jgi:Uma2 family endonuclease